MNKTNKTTKREHFNNILLLLAKAEDMVGGVDFSIKDTVDFIQNELSLLDNRSAAAKRRAEKQKEKGDQLRSQILEVISTEEFMCLQDILKALSEEVSDLTVQKIIPRCKQLVEQGDIEKGEVSVPSSDNKSRKVVGYRRIVHA